MNKFQTFPYHAMDGMGMGMGIQGHGMIPSMEPYQVLTWMAACGNSTSSSSSDSIRSCSKKSNDEAPKIPYPRDFVPGPGHVICGRGKKSYGHCGNKNFLATCAWHIDEYAAATTKQEKSDIVQAIVDALESKGGFIRLDLKTGLYFKAEEGAGREKTSQALRDCLNHKYKSSKDIKRQNRKEKRLAKQAVHQHVTEKRPSVMISTQADVTILSKKSSCLPPRTVSATSAEMSAAAAAAMAFMMPISPAPILAEWNPLGKDLRQRDEVHTIHEELEPLPFRSEEVERLPEVMGAFDFFL